MLLFFRHRNTSDPVIGEFEDVMLETLHRNFSGNIWVLPHLYDLPDSDGGLQEVLQEIQDRVREGGSPIFAFSWLPVRAATAILRQKIGGANSLDLTCFDLAEAKDSQNLAVLLESLALTGEKAAESSWEIRRIGKSLRRRWYPVIDYQVCQNCLECINFCLFGVYTIQKGQAPLVEQPDQCRDGCPACARVCPAGAILFPEYDDPVISGRQERTEPTESTAKDDLDRLIDLVG